MAAQNEPTRENRAERTAAQQIAFLIAAIAIVGLSLTGLPQTFSTERWAHYMIVIGGGIESLRIMHRIFALALLAVALYHVLAAGYSRYVLGRRMGMIPGFADFGALLGRILPNLGLARDNPSSNTAFSLRIEYLLVAVAVVILGLTGLVLWNPIAVTSVVSGEAVPIAQSVHSNHALLTMGSLLLLRIGIVLFWRPRRKDIFEGMPQPTLTAEQAAARRQRYLPAAVILAVAIAGGLFLFLNSEQTAIDTVPRQRAVIFAPQVLPDEGDPHIGEVLWGTLRCAFCHGADANGGAASQPSLHREDLTFEAFFQQVRVGRGEMPAFTAEELPDGYLVHLWAWLQQSVAATGN